MNHKYKTIFRGFFLEEEDAEEKRIGCFMAKVFSPATERIYMCSPLQVVPTSVCDWVPADKTIYCNPPGEGGRGILLQNCFLHVLFATEPYLFQSAFDYKDVTIIMKC